MCLVEHPWTVVLAVIITVGLIAITLTRLWTRQLMLSLEERLEIDTRLVPLRHALTVLRDAVAQTHAIAKELETLKWLREESSTVLVEIQAVRDQIAEVYNKKLDDVEVHRATLEELVESFRQTYRQLDEAYLRELIVYIVRRQELYTSGERLIEHLESNGFRINNKLRALIADFYRNETDSLYRGWSGKEGGANNECAERPITQ